MLLALDLGTNLGYALGENSIIKSGWVNLRKIAGKNSIPFAVFHDVLLAIIDDHKVNKIVVEIVRSHSSSGIKAAHFYGGLLALTKVFCQNHQIILKYAEVSTIKKTFTGHGRADKARMIKKAEEKGFNVTAHDEADAIAIWFLAKKYPYKLKEK